MTTQTHSRLPKWRIGIDLGGTKIAAVVLDTNGKCCAEARAPTPRNDYNATIKAIVALAKTVVEKADKQPRTASNFAETTIGIGIPGSISPRTGLVQNANSTWLNQRPFAQDLETAFAHPVHFANDADCFALSEAADGAGKDANIVFGVILGTGCGGSVVHDQKLLTGPRHIGGEWGHNPLPWPKANETPGPQCWCGRTGCMETWVSGPALSADHQRISGQALSPEDIISAAEAGNDAALATRARHMDRLARGLASVANIVDPDVIVLGGGLSQLPHLYRELPNLMARHLFCDSPHIAILPPRWGDASGVRGAARLWDQADI